MTFIYFFPYPFNFKIMPFYIEAVVHRDACSTLGATQGRLVNKVAESADDVGGWFKNSNVSVVWREC